MHKTAYISEFIITVWKKDRNETDESQFFKSQPVSFENRLTVVKFWLSSYFAQIISTVHLF